MRCGGAALIVPHRLCAVGHDGRVHAPVQPKPRRDKAVGARLSKPCCTE